MAGSRTTGEGLVMLRQPIVLVALLASVAVGHGEDKVVAQLTAEDVQAVQKKVGGLSEADARKKWAGKVVECSAAGGSYYREVDRGDHAGQTMFYFYPAEEKK